MKEKQGFYIHYHSRRVAMVWNDMQWYSYSLPFLLMQTFWMDTHWMDPYWWDTCWRYVLVGYVLVGYVCDSCWCTPFEWIRIEWIRIAWIRIGGIRIGGIRLEWIRLEWICVGYVWCAGYVWDMCGDWWDTYYNLLNGYALHGYVLVGYVWVGYVWNGYVWDMCDVLDMCGICVVDTFGMDMCGICVMCWICVGYVWCEIRQQSSEEPCDETSFGKKKNKKNISPESLDGLEDDISFNKYCFNTKALGAVL